MSKRPTMSHQTSSLIKMVESTGRTRGSSATPVQSGPTMVSPQPQRDLKAQIDMMDNEMQLASFGQGNPTRHSIPTNRGGPSQRHGRRISHKRSESTSSTDISNPSSQNRSVKIEPKDQEPSRYIFWNPNKDVERGNTNTGPGAPQFSANRGSPSQGASRQRMTVNELSATFQANLTELQDIISKTADIPPNVQETLTRDVREIAQQFNESQHALGKEIDNVRKERDDLRRQLQNSKEMQETLALRHRKSSERFDEIETQWKKVQHGLLDQISRQKEQLEGKRALWLDANPGSSARRDAMKALRDPFQSPSAHLTRYIRGAMNSMTSPSVMGQSQKALMPIRPSNKAHPLNYYNADSSKNPFNAGFNVGSTARNPRQHRRGTLASEQLLAAASYSFNGDRSESICHPTEAGSPPPSKALVVHQSEQAVADKYKAVIGNIFDLIEIWVRQYSSVPNQNNDRAIASGNNKLWDYMMNCTYPGHRQDAHTHVVTLLNDMHTRFWFVMRMATQYCMKEIMSIKAFRSYSKNVEIIIDEVLKKLAERGLNNDARQKYIDKGSNAVQSVVAAYDYNQFRAKQLSIHTKALRDMLGPLLNDHVPRAPAGTDLGAIVLQSWEVSCKMYTDRLTFQVYFPETASKFTAATMETKDNIGIDPMRLQIEQARLKLVITPVVTMRDDRGLTIKAKSLHSAWVLLMK